MMQSVELTINQNSILVRPWLSCLEAPLTCFRRKTKINYQVKGGMEMVLIPEPLFYTIHSGVPKQSVPTIGWVFGGLEETLKRTLKEKNIAFTIRDTRRTVPDFDFSVLDNIDFRFGQIDIIDAVLQNHQGILAGPPGLGKSFLIELICAGYYKKGVKILVVTTRSSVLRELHSRIATRDPNAELLLVNGQSGSAERVAQLLEKTEIAVCSSKSLHKIPAEWPDLLIYDEVHGAAAPEVSQVLATFIRARKFGFSASPMGRGDSADLLTEALFGPTICNIKYKDAADNSVVAPIEVWMLPVKCPEIIKTLPTSRDRWNIWRNRTRNEKIKAAVDFFPEDTQILILVNTAEHAFILQQLLPDFKVIYASLNDDQRRKFAKMRLCAPDTPLVLDHKKLQEDFKEGRIKRVIATTTWKEGVDFPDLNVVIRADATKGPIAATQIGGRSSRIRKGSKKTKGVIIDFTDEFGPRYQRRAKNRVSNYLKEAWTVIEGFGKLDEPKTDKHSE